MNGHRPRAQLGNSHGQDEEDVRGDLYRSAQRCLNMMQVVFTSEDPATYLAARMSLLELGNRRVSKTFVTFKTLTKFPLFSSFPLEIRRLIWKEALPGPRLLTLTASNYIDLLLRPAEGESLEVPLLTHPYLFLKP